MRSAQILKSLILSLVICCGLRCGQPAAVPGTPPSEAHRKFLQLCTEEYGLKPVTTSLPHTLVVYLPTEHEILDMKANGPGPTKSSVPEETTAILFLDGTFENSQFHLTYDIAPQKTYSADPGYGNFYSDDYSRKQKNVLQALFRTYGDAGPTPAADSGAGNETRPDFIVLVIADVKNGIEVTLTFSLTDFKRAYTGALPSEEYRKRTLTKIIGSKSIIGDDRGRHLKVKDLTWPGFLARQMVSRIKFKYQQSAFPPAGDNEEDILKIVNTTVKAYAFEDFQAVRLEDLTNGKNYLFDREQLKRFQAEK